MFRDFKKIVRSEATRVRISVRKGYGTRNNCWLKNITGIWCKTGELWSIRRKWGNKCGIRSLGIIANGRWTRRRTSGIWGGRTAPMRSRFTNAIANGSRSQTMRLRAEHNTPLKWFIWARYLQVFKITKPNLKKNRLQIWRINLNRFKILMLFNLK